MAQTSKSPTRTVRKADAFRWLAVTAVMVSACVGAPAQDDGAGTRPTQAAAKPMTHPASDQHAPRAALQAFLEAAGKDDFEACYRLLAGSWRERYTPARLEQDFRAVRGTAEDKLARARSALLAEPWLDEGRAQFPISERKAVRLVLESGGWKVAALE